MGEKRMMTNKTIKNEGTKHLSLPPHKNETYMKKKLC